jgi:peptidyl-prolyl cis-trans isomerase C
MQRTLRNLAVALVAGTFAFAAGAQEKVEKASKKSAARSESSASGKVVVNGVTIPQSRIDAMNRELTSQGQPDSPERHQAVKEELVNREVLAQAAAKRGLDRSPDIAAQMEMANTR